MGVLQPPKQPQVPTPMAAGQGRDDTLTTCPGSPGTPGGPCKGDMSRNQVAAQALGTARKLVGGMAEDTYPWAGGARGTRQPHTALGTGQALQQEQLHQRRDTTMPWHSPGQKVCGSRASWFWGGHTGARWGMGQGHTSAHPDARARLPWITL